MRRTLTVIVTAGWLLPAAASGQVSLGSAQVPGISVTWNTPPAPPPAPPPQAPPPHQPNGGPMTGGDQFLADPDTYAPRSGRTSRRARGGRQSRLGHGFGYSPYGYLPFVGGYMPYYAQPYTADTTGRVGPGAYAEPDGRLYLRVIPGDAQVFVDGLYVGIADDLGGRGLELEAGPRRVELRADGYETVVFDVRVVAGETINYRKELSRLETRPEAPRIAAVPKTFYVIPRCYAGDTPPRSEQLRPGCRVADLRTVPPVVGAASARR